MPDNRRQNLRPHKRGTRIEPTPSDGPRRAPEPSTRRTPDPTATSHRAPATAARRTQEPATAARRTPTPAAASHRAPAPSAPRRKGPAGVPLLPVLAVIALAVVIGGAVTIRGCISSSSDPGAQAQQAAEPTGPATVHFVAVGDNLPEIDIASYADAQAGEVGDGEYDFSPVYAPIKQYVESADLAYVKEETHLGGDDIGPKGYPSFNTPDAMADAIVETGFDLVGSASNHSYDWGYYGANDHSRKVWNTKPVVFTGTASSEEEAAKIATIEKNGITFALLDYTYGVNGYDREDLPSYAVNFIDKDRIADDVARAQEMADVVLVAMHWGTENLMDADETQLEYAQYLADLGVDVVLGSHPHVIGPMAWVEGEGGNRTLVAYSLGNFLSKHESPGPKNELEGMLSCDFVKEGDEVRIENVVWTPLVNHTDGSTYAVYALKDYTAELAAAHPTFVELEDPIAWLRETSAEVVNGLGGEFAIDDGAAPDDGAASAEAEES